MLGIGRTYRTPVVCAHGKHPSFDDYFSLNMTALPLASALCAWIEKGIARQATGSPAAAFPCAYRFWIKGIKRRDLVIGIVRDSSDSLGRPYPLLAMIGVDMKDRNRCWHQIFSLFDPMFRGLEDSGAARFGRFKDFEAALVRSALSALDTSQDPGRSDLSLQLSAWFEIEKQHQAMILPLSMLKTRHKNPCPGNGARRLFSRSVPMPSTMFSGGTAQAPVVAFYNRPLKASDFTDLFRTPGALNPSFLQKETSDHGY